MDVYIESTKDAEYKDGVITFPNNGIVATYGNNIRVVNSNIQTEIRMPGAGLTTCFIYRSFYQYGDGMEASVQWKDSLQCLHTRVRFTNLDEVRAVCVNPDETDMAVTRLKNDPSYGVTVNAEGWIDVPIYATGTQMCLVYIGLLNNIIRYEYSDVPFTYPDYSLDLYLYGKTDKANGTSTPCIISVLTSRRDTSSLLQNMQTRTTSSLCSDRAPCQAQCLSL